MKNINKVLMGLVMGVGMIYMSGCAVLTPCSTYNHNRVKEDAIGQQIVAKGNPEQVRAMSAGVKPSSVIKIIPTTDARGAYVAMDLWNPDNWTYFKTYAEAPISSTAALLGDGTLWGGLIYLGSNLIDGQNGKQSTTISINGDGSNNLNVNSSNNKSSVESSSGGSGGNNVNVNSSGNTSTIINNPPPVTP